MRAIARTMIVCVRMTGRLMDATNDRGARLLCIVVLRTLRKQNTNIYEIRFGFVDTAAYLIAGK
jgi:hypothetical protein